MERRCRKAQRMMVGFVGHRQQQLHKKEYAELLFDCQMVTTEPIRKWLMRCAVMRCWTWNISSFNLHLALCVVHTDPAMVQMTWRGRPPRHGKMNRQQASRMLCSRSKSKETHIRAMALIRGERETNCNKYYSEYLIYYLRHWGQYRISRRNHQRRRKRRQVGAAIPIKNIVMTPVTGQHILYYVDGYGD